jgi:hypothetical protein
MFDAPTSVGRPYHLAPTFTYSKIAAGFGPEEGFCFTYLVKMDHVIFI